MPKKPFQGGQKFWPIFSPGMYLREPIFGVRYLVLSWLIKYRLTIELILSICFREKKVAASVLGSRVAADDPAPCQVSSNKIFITPSTEHPCAVVKTNIAPIQATCPTKYEMWQCKLCPDSSVPKVAFWRNERLWFAIAFPSLFHF